MRFRKTLELILASLISLAVLAMPKKAKAADSFIVLADSNNLTKTSIAENHSAWSDSGNIIVYDRRMDMNDPNSQFIADSSGQASNPCVDANNLVYERAGGIWWQNLETKANLCIFPNSSYGTPRFPKINLTNIVFRLDTATGQEIWGADVNKGMNIREIRYFPVTNSGNPKNAPDIYNNIVAWPELVEKANSGFEHSHDLVDGDWDIHAYNLATGKEIIIDSEPNMSTGSTAIYKNLIVYSWNTKIDGPTGIMIYYLNNNNPINPLTRYRKSLPGPRGKVDEIAIHKNVISWTRSFISSYHLPPHNLRKRAEAMYLLDVLSHGYKVFDEGGDQSGSDSFKRPDESYIVSFATVDSNVPPGIFSGSEGISSASSEPSEPAPATIMTTFTNPLDRDLSYVYKNWLRPPPKDPLMPLFGDYYQVGNQKGIVNLYDFSQIIKSHQLIKTEKED